MLSNKFCAQKLNRIEQILVLKEVKTKASRKNKKEILGGKIRTNAVDYFHENFGNQALL